MKNLSPDRFLLLKQSLSAKAINSSSVTFTFDQLRQKVLATASLLRNQKISSGDRVGIFGHNSVEFVINVLALWQLSAVPVPLNIRLTEKEIDEQLSLSNCSIILVQKDFSKKNIKPGKQIIEYPFNIDEDSSLKNQKE